MKYAAILVMLLCVCMTAGCSYLDEGAPVVHPTNTPTTQATPESKVSTVETSAMALQLSDLPDGYIIRERSDMSFEEISPLARDTGWKQGYYVAFYRMDVKTYDMTGITQQISIYPPDQIKIIFDDVKASLLSTANATITITELPFPKTGDYTVGMRTVDANNPYGIMTYTVVFTKKDVLEQIEMRGTTTDYEVLKNIAATAAQKIR
jgi:hypothetical protein